MKQLILLALIAFTAINCKSLRFLSLLYQRDIDPNFIQAIEKEIKLFNSSKMLNETSKLVGKIGLHENGETGMFDQIDTENWEQFTNYLGTVMNLEEDLNKKLIDSLANSHLQSEDEWKRHEILYKDSKSKNVHYVSIFAHFDQKKNSFTVIYSNHKLEIKLAANLTMFKTSSSFKGEQFKKVGKVGKKVPISLEYAKLKKIYKVLKYESLKDVYALFKIKPTEPEVSPTDPDEPVKSETDPDEPVKSETDPDEPMDEPKIVSDY